ncbi:hypothetical protein [Mesorhizobium sp.]|uniref:hypothetical protein n=1 Tax=Mesorhizobium sp. TaxID=1871066 RepID=UPI000FE6647B|nr:hypothetical protein [Mesorhizobium sp.]RWD96107.1 MAG: hypothetical protein EOS40_34335 [Mesorhizobium sp.]
MTDQVASKKARSRPTGSSAARSKSKPEPAGAAAGRPKRSKKTLGDDFTVALRADFRAHGAGVIAAVRAEKPEQYLKVVLTLLPKDFSQNLDADKNNLDRMSDEELRNRIRGLEARLRPFLDDADLSGADRGTGSPPSP